jgi:hypothetical protein
METTTVASTTSAAALSVVDDALGLGASSGSGIDFSLDLPGTPAPAASSSDGHAGDGGDQFSLDLPRTPAVPANLRSENNNEDVEEEDLVAQVLAETPIPATLASSFGAAAAAHLDKAPTFGAGMFNSPGSATSFLAHEQSLSPNGTPGGGAGGGGGGGAIPTPATGSALIRAMSATVAGAGVHPAGGGLGHVEFSLGYPATPASAHLTADLTMASPIEPTPSPDRSVLNTTAELQAALFNESMSSDTFAPAASPAAPSMVQSRRYSLGPPSEHPVVAPTLPVVGDAAPSPNAAVSQWGNNVKVRRLSDFVFRGLCCDLPLVSCLLTTVFLFSIVSCFAHSRGLFILVCTQESLEISTMMGKFESPAVKLADDGARSQDGGNIDRYWKNEQNPAFGTVLETDAAAETGVPQVTRVANDAITNPSHENLVKLGKLACGLAETYADMQNKLALKEREGELTKQNELDIATADAEEMEEHVQMLEESTERAEAERDELMEEVKEQEQEIAALRAQLSAAKADGAASTDELLDQLNTTKADGAKFADEKDDEIEALRARNDVLGTDNLQHTFRISQLETDSMDLEPLKERTEKLVETVLELEQDVGTARATATMATQLLSEMKDELTRTKAELDQLQMTDSDDVAAVSFQMAAMEQAMLAAKRETDEQRATVAALLTERAAAATERDAAQNTSMLQVDALQSMAVESEEMLAQVIEERDAAVQALQETQTLLSNEHDGQVRKADLESVCAELESVEQKLEEQTSNYELDVSELKEEADLLKAELASSKSTSQIEDTSSIELAVAASKLIDAEAAILQLETELGKFNAAMEQAEETELGLRAELTAAVAERDAMEVACAAADEARLEQERSSAVAAELSVSVVDFDVAEGRGAELQFEVDGLNEKIDVLEQTVAEQRAAILATASSDQQSEQAVAAAQALHQQLSTAQAEMVELQLQASVAVEEKMAAIRQAEMLQLQKNQSEIVVEQQSHAAAAELHGVESRVAALQSRVDAADAVQETYQLEIRRLEAALTIAQVSAEQQTMVQPRVAFSPGMLPEGTRLLVCIENCQEFAVGEQGQEQLDFVRGDYFLVANEPDQAGNFHTTLHGREGTVPAACLLDAKDIMDQLATENASMQQEVAVQTIQLREELVQLEAEHATLTAQYETTLAATQTDAVQHHAMIQQAESKIDQLATELAAEQGTKALLQFGNTQTATQLSSLGERCSMLETELQTKKDALARAEAMLAENVAGRHASETRDSEALSSLTSVVTATQSMLQELKAERHVHLTVIDQHRNVIEKFETMVVAQQQQHAALAVPHQAQADVPDYGKLRSFLDEISTNIVTLKDQSVAARGGGGGGNGRGDSSTLAAVGSADAYVAMRERVFTLESELSRTTRMLAAEQVAVENLTAEVHLNQMAVRSSEMSFAGQGGFGGGAAAAAVQPGAIVASPKKSVSQRRLIREANRAHEKQLRAESFRKALVYQKKYLLLQLGKFRTSEAVTLLEISRSGVDKFKRKDGSPLFRFRSAVIVIIAQHRMKTLAKRWSGFAK